MQAQIVSSPISDKRYRVLITKKKSLLQIKDFGSSKHENFTMHKDIERKKRYIARHKKNENWTKTGYKTAGFWSRWLLWNKPTLEESAKDIKERFNIKVKILEQ